MAETNIYRAYNFILDIGGNHCGYFTVVGGLSVNIETLDYREGGAGLAVRKLAGRVSYGDVELKWGCTDDKVMWGWLMNSCAGKVERKNVSICLQNCTQNGEDTRWNLDNAWPCKWRGAQLDALSNEVAIETLCLTHEGLERA